MLLTAVLERHEADLMILALVEGWKAIRSVCGYEVPEYLLKDLMVAINSETLKDSLRHQDDDVLSSLQSFLMMLNI
jgi:hypothetical protein